MSDGEGDPPQDPPQGKKPRRSKRTPVAGTEVVGPPERPTPKPRRSKKTPPAGTPEAPLFEPKPLFDPAITDEEREINAKLEAAAKREAERREAAKRESEPGVDGAEAPSEAPADQATREADPREAQLEADAKREADAEPDAHAKLEAEAQRETQATLEAEAQREAQAKLEADAKREADAQREAQARLDAEAQREAQARLEADAKREAEAQREAQATIEAEAQREAQAKLEAEAKREAEAKLATEREAHATLEADAKREAEAKLEADAKREAEAKLEADAKLEAEAKREADAKLEADAKREAEAKLEADAKREAEAKLEAQAKREADAKREAEAKLEADAKREAEAKLASEREAGEREAKLAATAKLAAEQAQARLDAEEVEKAQREAEAKLAAEDDERRSGHDRRKRPTAEPPLPGMYTDPEAATLPQPEAAGVAAPAPAQSLGLNPAAAAFEAARIAGEIVGDIESASGAAIVAAAAAGAAIEAARARRAAGAPAIIADADHKATDEVSATMAAAAATAATTAATTEPPVQDGTQGDPVTTVRMHRERILRALAEEISASPAIQAEGSLTVPLAPTGPSASQQMRAQSQADELSDESVADPVAIAAAAIQRLRQRASTDFAELRVHYHRHDIVVLVAAFLLIIVAGRIHDGMVTPPTVLFPPKDDQKAQRGLVFEHSQAWLKPEELPPSPPRIVRDPTGQPPKPGDAYHVALTSSVDPAARIEILIDKQPAWTNIVTGLELDRRTRWGEMYTLDDSSVEEIGDQNWLRTAYRYAHVVEKGDVPRVDRAVEYATVDREQIYVVTLFGSQSELSTLESVVAPTLRIVSKTRSALPLVPQTRTSIRRTYPNPVARAFDSTVMVVVADLIDGRLQARGGGSGVIVGADGSILTNYHVVHDKNGRLHDAFIIGRFSTLDRAPQLQCAGRPNRSKLQRELDLALIKCDTDLDGRTWTPASAGIWGTLVEAKQSDVKIGQRLWVLGFPDAGGGGLTLSEGEIGGWTGVDGANGKDFIKTDASITRGNSGGPVVDDQGRLVGIATATKTRISATGGVAEIKQFGLVRPLSTAADLLAIAAIGWTPREGHTDVEIQPSAVEAPAEGVRIATHVIDAANEAPIRDALVMVLRPGVSASEIDVNRLDDQVISWGRSNAQGEVQLKQPVPYGTYTVLVRASGYEPLIGEDKLRLDDKSPPALDPWSGIKLLAR